MYIDLWIVVQIVWDPEKKKWINTEQDESEETPFKPPPKMPGFAPNQFAHAVPAIPTIPPHQSTDMASSEPSNVMGNTMMTYRNAPTPSTFGNASQLNRNSVVEPEASAKVPSLQSNVYKMQRNKSE